MNGALLIAWLMASFAAYRLTRLLVTDSLFEHTRDKIQARLVRDALWAEKASDLVSCPYCVGAWVSLVVWAAVARYGIPYAWHLPLVLHGVMWMAVTGGQAQLQHLDGR